MIDPDNRLLMIDDEPAICTFVGVVAKRLGFDFRHTVNADEFRRLVNDFAPTALVLDLNMPHVDGIELLRFLANSQCRAPILVISGEDSRVLAAAERLGTSQGLKMADTLQKPILLPVLKAALGAVMQQTITVSSLRKAIERNELRLHYQPKLARRGDGIWALDGAEALVRWRHSEFGIVMPGDFIPLATQGGLISAITDFVLREAVEQLAHWRDRGLVLNIAVNIPPDLLTDVEFPDRLSILLRQYHLEGSHLTLEVTESAAMQDADTVMDILTRLRLKGVQVAIDDFGTGYSSLKQLFYMPFSELKIDGSFVTEIDKSNEARIIVRTMIQMGHNLGLSICAEAVETQETLNFLEAERCDKVQGYFFSRPTDAVELEKFARIWSDGATARSASAAGTSP